MTWHPKMPMEYRNQIVTGDAREMAKRIPDESIDIIFTSPPYNVGVDYGTWDDDMPNEQFWIFQEDWLRSAIRIARISARAYVIVSDTMLWPMHELVERLGWIYHQLLVWCKPNIVRRGRISKDWHYLAEWCLLLHKGKRTPMLGEIIGISTYNWIVAATPQSNFNGHKRKKHPAQMSFDVAYSWLARTPGAIVYEPFAGSGTTCMAAKALRRNYVAFEIDPATAELARERVANTQPPLFVPEPEQMELEL